MKKSSEARAERIEADLLALQKHVTKALRPIGKVSESKNSCSTSRGLSVQSAAGAYLNVTVQKERQPWVFGDSPVGHYTIRVEGAEHADFRTKHRVRDFNGIAADASAETLAPVVACVQKHLAAKDEAAAERARREAASEKRKELDAQLDAQLGAIGERLGIARSYRDDELRDGALRVRRKSEGYEVKMEGLSEADLESVLTFWRSFRRP